jgi:uncharacterized protein
MELRGTVLNVVDFGAFVDVGLKDSGLVHISQMATEFIRSPHEKVSVGDVVTVWVQSVDLDRRRVSLSMLPPGTPSGSRSAQGVRAGEAGSASAPRTVPPQSSRSPAASGSNAPPPSAAPANPPPTAATPPKSSDPLRSFGQLKDLLDDRGP